MFISNSFWKSPLYLGRYSTESDLIYQQQQQQINLNTNDRRANFGGVKSMSMDSQGSGNSQGSTSALGHGGSYSSKTGASMKSFIGEGLGPLSEGSGRPKLAEVAKALLAAQAAGELPQASKKDLELQVEEYIRSVYIFHIFSCVLKM